MSILRRIFETLREYYAMQPPQAWWPDDPLEVVVGAVLVQGTTWKSVQRVLERLKENQLLDFRRLTTVSDDELATIIRPVGFHTKKVKRLKEVATLVLHRSDGDLARFFARDADLVRRELLSISGIGPGTADNMLLYAGGVPIYMVDPFTIRVLQRHGIIDSSGKETEIQQLVHRELTPDEEPYGAKLFGGFQALMVRLGREFCGKTAPTCGICPLRDLLPETGPVGIENTTRSVALPPQLLPRQKKSGLKPIEELELDAIEHRIVCSLSSEPMSIDSVVQSTGLPVHIVRATIAILEMRKILQQVEGNQVRRIS